jgi:hypothetical protein
VKTLREEGPKEVRDFFWDWIAEEGGKNQQFYSLQAG